MRKLRKITLAAGGRWPDGNGDLGGVAFNWVRIDNRGSNGVDFSLGAQPTAGDLISTDRTIAAGKCRTFNVAGPKIDDGPAEDWPRELWLVSTSGTTLVLEVADHPIVDMTF